MFRSIWHDVYPHFALVRVAHPLTHECAHPTVNPYPRVTCRRSAPVQFSGRPSKLSVSAPAAAPALASSPDRAIDREPARALVQLTPVFAKLCEINIFWKKSCPIEPVGSVGRERWPTLPRLLASDPALHPTRRTPPTPRQRPLVDSAGG